MAYVITWYGRPRALFETVRAAGLRVRKAPAASREGDWTLRREDARDVIRWRSFAASATRASYAATPLRLSRAQLHCLRILLAARGAVVDYRTLFGKSYATGRVTVHRLKRALRVTPFTIRSMRSLGDQLLPKKA